MSCNLTDKAWILLSMDKVETLENSIRLRVICLREAARALLFHASRLSHPRPQASSR